MTKLKKLQFRSTEKIATQITYEAAHSCAQPINVPNEFIDFRKNDAMES